MLSTNATANKFETCLEQKIYHKKSGSNYLIPFYSSKVSAGFPSPADDYIEAKIDLNELVSKNSPAVFMVCVNGTSMIDAGINDGDYIAVDRSIQPTNGKTVVVSIDGSVTVKILQSKNGKAFLMAANSNFGVIEINENSNVEIFGVVVSVTHFF